MYDHKLAAFDTRLFLPDRYVCGSSEPIVVEKHLSEQDLIAKTVELALEAVVEIFEHYNGNTASGRSWRRISASSESAVSASCSFSYYN